MDIPTLLDEAKKAQGFTTDMALAKAMKISRSAVSAWRNGLKTPDTVQCAALAGFTGLPLAKVLGIAGEARAISREEKAVWRKLAASTLSLALLWIGLSLAGILSSAPASASPAHTQEQPVEVGIMRNRLWRLLHRIREFFLGRPSRHHLAA